LSLDGTVCLWDTGDWSYLCTLTARTEVANSCAFAPDGGTLVTVSDDRTARVWATRS